MPTFQEVERAMSTLWLDRESRDWLLSGDPITDAPDMVRKIDPSIIAQLDRKGASVYGRSIAYEHQNMADRIFPYCAKAVNNDWEELVGDYYKTFPSTHFDFNKICANFPTYLKEQRGDILAKFPWLAELALYEWLELEKLECAIDVLPGEEVSIDSLEKISVFAPVLNQTLTLCRFTYPIGEIASYIDECKRVRKKFAKSDCRMVIYRDPESDQARFIELGEASAAIVESAETSQSYLDLLKLTLSLTPESDPATITVEFLGLVEELQNDNIFVGSIKKGN